MKQIKPTPSLLTCLVYTGYVLDIANEWRVFLGLQPDPLYDAIAGGLASLPLDPGSAEAGVPRYTLNLLCACYYLEASVPQPF